MKTGSVGDEVEVCAGGDAGVQLDTAQAMAIAADDVADFGVDERQEDHKSKKCSFHFESLLNNLIIM